MLDAAHMEGTNDDTEHDQEFYDVHGWTEKKGTNKKNHLFLLATDNLEEALQSRTGEMVKRVVL